MSFDISTNEGMLNSIAWTRNMLSQMADGGVWYVPRCASSYRVDKRNKTLTRSGMKPDTAINKVVAACGWTVIENH